ncbi:MAG: hypothetical protein ACODAA_04060 [Gemmatimonadota bacterium]
MTRREDELFDEHGIYREPATGRGGWGRDIATATAILTAFAPAGTRGGVPVGEAPSSRRAFPVVGFLLGVLAAAVWALADSLGFYSLGASVLAIGTIAVIGGLLSATLLTLIVVPVIYSLLVSPGERVSARAAAPTATTRGIPPDASPETAS